MTFAQELLLDKNSIVFTDELFQSYIEMHKRAVSRQESIMKTLIFGDSALALLMSGNSLTIPGIDFNLIDIPSAPLILAVIMSYSFMTMCLAFTNAQHYEAITQVYAQHRCGETGVDSDFVSAAHTLSELYVKTFRAKMNNTGMDFFGPGSSYKIFYGTILFICLAAVLGFVALHFYLILIAVLPETWTIASSLLFALCGLANLAGLLAAAGPSFLFTETLPPSHPAPQTQTPEEAPE
ncbi:MAG: hypothetical protein CML02_02230 [Pseudooceanicola sp.]|nr:hypothetical protein [Pseudooceanicola sp.]